MYKIFINEEEVYASKKFKIIQEFLNTSSVTLNDVYPLTWENDRNYISNFFAPDNYSKVEIIKTNGEYQKTIFTGVIKNTGNISLNPREKKTISFSASDFKILLSEGKILDFVIKDKTINEAIQMVIDEISDYGFKAGNINIENGEEKIGAYSTLDQSAYDVFQYFSEISGSLWTTRNEDGVTYIDFYDIDTLEEDESIEYTQEYFEKNNIVNIEYSMSTNDYRNKQEIVSKNVYGSNDVSETIYATGYNRIYNTKQKIGTIKSIVRDNQEILFLTKKENEMGKAAEYYYEAGENYFYKDEDLNIDEAGKRIYITYTPLVKGREISIDFEEAKRIGEITGRNGTISRYEERDDLTEQSQLSQVAETYLKFKGKPEFTLKVKTVNNDILTIGHKVKFLISDLDFLNTEYLIKTKTIETFQAGEEMNEFYTYELSSNFNAETSLNYYDNQRRKTEGNINENETIDRNIDLVDITNIIFKNLSIKEIEENSDD